MPILHPIFLQIFFFIVLFATKKEGFVGPDITTLKAMILKENGYTCIWGNCKNVLPSF